MFHLSLKTGIFSSYLWLNLNFTFGFWQRQWFLFDKLVWRTFQIHYSIRKASVKQCDEFTKFSLSWTRSTDVLSTWVIFKLEIILETLLGELGLLQTWNQFNQSVPLSFLPLFILDFIDFHCFHFKINLRMNRKYQIQVFFEFFLKLRY